MQALCRNATGRHARLADFAPAIYRPMPAATMISSRNQQGRRKNMVPRACRGRNRADFAFIAQRLAGFNQIALE